MSAIGLAPPRAAVPATAVPWATALVVVAALAAAALDPAGAPALLYVRERIFAGEVWRLWTAHLAHFGLSHLGWNLLVLAPLGAWAERIAPGRLRCFYAVGPALVGGALLLGDASLHRYGGLSGLVTGVVVLVALAQFAGGPGRDRWIGWALLGLVAAKTAWEVVGGAALFSALPAGDVRPVPLAHAAGALAAAGVYFVGRGRGA